MMPRYQLLLADEQARLVRRHRLLQLTLWCVAILCVLRLATMPAVGASTSWTQWCHQSDERLAWCEHQEWQAWVADPANERWWYAQYGVLVPVGRHFGVGTLGQQAQRIVDCESQGKPTAVNPSSGAAGLFQIMPSYHRHAFERVTGVRWADGWHVADLNAQYARDLYDRKGWQPWVCQP